METILKYFSKLTDAQKQQFEALYDLYHDWNNKINVISRKDIDSLYEHHVLHSLAIANAIKTEKSCKTLWLRALQHSSNYSNSIVAGGLGDIS